MTSASDLVTLYADIDSAVRRVSPYAPANGDKPRGESRTAVSVPCDIGWSADRR